MKRALVIVDVQNDFCEGGALAVQGGNDVARKIMEHVTGLQKDFYNVIYTTQDWHVDPGNHWSETPDFVDTWPVHCAAGTKGAELHPAIEALSPLITARHFKGMYKAAYSGMEAEVPLDFWGIHAVDVVGLALDYCVFQTAVDIQKNIDGVEVKILTDLCAAINPEQVEQQKQANPLITYV